MLTTFKNSVCEPDVAWLLADLGLWSSLSQGGRQQRQSWGRWAVCRKETDQMALVQDQKRLGDRAGVLEPCNRVVGRNVCRTYFRKLYLKWRMNQPRERLNTVLAKDLILKAWLVHVRFQFENGIPVIAIWNKESFSWSGTISHLLKA